MNPDNQRLKEVFNYLRQKQYVRNQQHFTELIGSDKASVSQALNGKISIPNVLFGKISIAFPFINSEWIRTGEGEMLRGGVRQTTHGDNSPNINGDNTRLGTEFSPDAALKEIEAQRKLTERAMAMLEKKDAQIEKKDEQISHLLSLLHK